MTGLIRNFEIHIAAWAKKIYRLKEDQAFWLSLELGRREKVARQTSADFLPSPTPFVSSRQWRSFSPRRGWSRFCGYYYCSYKNGMRDNWFCEYSILENKFLHYFFLKIYSVCFLKVYFCKAISVQCALMFCSFAGPVSQDFLLQVFFMNHLPSSPWK